jgi:hypothetical protein
MNDLLREIADELDRLEGSFEYREAQEAPATPKEIKLARKMLVKARTLAENDVGALARVVSDWASSGSKILRLVSELYRQSTHPGNP